MTETREKLLTTTILLHWLIAVPMIAMLGMGLYLESLPVGPEKNELVGVHMGVGLIILCLAVLRSIWRLSHGFPPAVGEYRKWEQRLAKIAHWALLLATMLLPISGIVMTLGSGRAVSFFGTPVFGPFEKIELMSNVGHVMHGLGGRVIIVMVVLHIAGALKHALIDGDGTMKRIVGKPTS